MQRPKLLLPAALAVTVIGAGCGKSPAPAKPPVAHDAVVVVPDARPPDAAPPDAAQAIWEPPDYPIG